MTEKVICFDLEGPLSPQDNAYEVMGLIPDGHRIFEAISLYDDILTLEHREGYEPGDTLSLIVPFLVRHRITEAHIRKVSDSAKIVDGVPQMISRLGELGWTPHIISTSYRQHAYSIGEKIGVPEGRIHATNLPLKEFAKKLSPEEDKMLAELESDILTSLYPNLGDEKRLKERLDRFYYGEAAETAFGRLMSEVVVVGGQRKVDAAVSVSEAAGVPLSEVVAVGDSITDYKMLGRVRDEGGVAVAFNGNKYAIPYANVGLATTDMRFLLVVVMAQMRGGTAAALEAAHEWEMHQAEYMEEPDEIPDELIPKDVRKLLEGGLRKKTFFPPHYHLLSDASQEKLAAVAKIHAESRKLVRGAAAKLG